MPDDVVRPPANVVAQLMLQCVQDDPTLIKRSRGLAKAPRIRAVQPPAMQLEPISPPMLLSGADPATKQYFEDLVSIAVASSERADDLLHEAFKANRKAAHATWAFASIAAVSIAMGAVGIVGSRHGNAADNRLAAMAGEVKPPDQQQQRADRQFAAVRSQIADEHPATETPRQTADVPPADTQDATPAMATPVETIPVETLPVETLPVETIPVETSPANAVQPAATQPFGATPANPVQQATYSPPWPVYHHHHPRRAFRTVQRRRIVVPRFLVMVQQNLRTLFR